MLPVMLMCEDKRILVVGWGKVGQRKGHVFAKEGAQVDIWDPRMPDVPSPFRRLEALADQDLRHYDLIVIASNDTIENNRLQALCKTQKIWCMRSDHKQGDVLGMSMVKQEDLVIAVSTQGGFAGLSKRIASDIKRDLPGDFDDYVRWMIQQRQEIIQTHQAPKKAIEALLEITYQHYRLRHKGSDHED